jgi:hypothetical protein
MPTVIAEPDREKSVAAMLKGQRADGYWSTSCDAGPACTAKVLVALRFAEELDALAPARLERAVERMCSQQLKSGGFPPWPVSEVAKLGTDDRGATVSATAAVLAGLQASGLRTLQVRTAMERARTYLGDDPKFARVIERGGEGDYTALYLAMAGLIEIRALPPTPIVFRLVPGTEYVLEQRVNLLLPLQMLVYDAIAHFLKAGKRAPDHLDVRSMAASLLGFGRGGLTDVRARALTAFSSLVGSAAQMAGGWKVLPGTLPAYVEGERLKLLLSRYENADGSWLYGDAVTTSLAVAALHALGTPKSDRRVRGAVDWLVGLAEDDFFPIFRTDIWATAFRLRALMALGVAPWSDAPMRALKWLLDVQRHGSWAFQAGNTALPDVDDSAMALATLATAYDVERAHVNHDKGPGVFGKTLRGRIEQTLLAGRAGLLARQNADGGWPSFQPGLPSKPPGPFMTGAPPMPKDSILGRWDFLLDPPPEIGDPAVEDVTGRVLFALGRMGMRSFDPPIAKAIEFLKRNQMDGGSWWGRWVVTYVPATAWVLRGLAAVGADLTEPWIRKAVQFLEASQDESGGWGEGVDVVRYPAGAGKGLPTRFHTGSAVAALLEVQPVTGRRSIERGIAFLRGLTDPDVGDGVVYPLVPPESFYTMPGIDRDVACEAIGLFERMAAHPAAAPGRRGPRPTPARPKVAVTADALEQMLHEGDDQMSAILDEWRLAPGGLGDLFQALARLDGAAGAALPAGGAEALAQLVSQPATVSDPQRQTARALFERCGWGVVATLFCSSLPQCFAFAKGAAVLAGTGRLTRTPQRRIVETMQFVFDVATASPHDARASMIRVRLMHELIRRETVADGNWDQAQLGKPINQQHLLATMLSFGKMVPDGLRAIGLELGDDEEEAWLALWRDAGVHLGIRREHLDLVDSPAAAEELLHLLREVGWHASAAGTLLAAALVETMQGYMPAERLASLPVALIRHIAGDRCADVLELPDADWTGALLSLERPVSELTDPLLDLSPVGYVTQAASYAILQGVAASLREGKSAHFRIPDDLLAKWRREGGRLSLL